MGYCSGTIKGDMKGCSNDPEIFGDCTLGASNLLGINKGDSCDHAIFRGFHMYNLHKKSKDKLSPELKNPDDYRKSYKKVCENALGCKWIPGAVKAINNVHGNNVVSVVNKNPSSINCEKYSQTCGFKAEIESCEKKYEDSQSNLLRKSNKLDISYGINFGLSLAIVILIVVLILNKKK